MQKEALTDKEFDHEMWNLVQTLVKYGLSSVGSSNGGRGFSSSEELGRYLLCSRPKMY